MEYRFNYGWHTVKDLFEGVISVASLKDYKGHIHALANSVRIGLSTNSVDNFVDKEA